MGDEWGKYKAVYSQQTNQHSETHIPFHTMSPFTYHWCAKQRHRRGNRQQRRTHSLAAPRGTRCQFVVVLACRPWSERHWVRLRAKTRGGGVFREENGVSLCSDSVSRSFFLKAACALSMHFFFFYWTCLFVSVKQRSAINLSRNRAKVVDATWAIWKIYSGSHSKTVAVVALGSQTQCINCSASWCVVQARVLGLLCTSTSWLLFVRLSSNLDLHPQTHGLCCAVLLAHDGVLHCAGCILENMTNRPKWCEEHLSWFLLCCANYQQVSLSDFTIWPTVTWGSGGQQRRHSQE